MILTKEKYSITITLYPWGVYERGDEYETKI